MPTRQVVELVAICLALWCKICVNVQVGVVTSGSEKINTRVRVSGTPQSEGALRVSLKFNGEGCSARFEFQNRARIRCSRR